MKNSTLIFIDWDDTLFPTTWVMNNHINLSDKQNKVKYYSLFSELDDILYKFFIKTMNYGTIIIVTNASRNWINVSMEILPKSSSIINNNIKIVSARDRYSDTHTVFKWKELSFKDEADGFFYHDTQIQNIVSIGDADYEHIALIKLDEWEKKLPEKRILKKIKLMHQPSYYCLIDQLEVLTSCIDGIIKKKKHMDLLFKIE